MKHCSKWITRNGWFLVLLIAAIIITLEIFRFDKEGALTDRIIAWATILLAIATVLLAKVTVNEGGKSRKDLLDKEVRDRNERLLNEIKDWAHELNSKVFLFDSEVLSDEIPMYNFQMPLLKRYLKYFSNLELENVNIEYFKHTSQYLSESLLQSIIKTETEILSVKNKIKEDAKLLSEVIENRANTSDKIEFASGITANNDSFRSKIKGLTSEIAKAKIAILKQ